MAGDGSDRAGGAVAPPDFHDRDLLARLDARPLDGFDDLRFGLIVMDRRGVVVGYNAFESNRAGIPAARVLGRDFFVDVGPCTDNHLVAGRYRREERLDEEIDYVFTLRMRPTPVRLRLLAAPGSPRQYLAVVPR